MAGDSVSELNAEITVEMAMVNALQGKRAPMKAATLEVPPELTAIVDRACQLRPADRYASVAEMAADVRRYMNNEEVQALPDTLPRRLGRWLSAHRMLASARDDLPDRMRSGC